MKKMYLIIVVIIVIVLSLGGWWYISVNVDKSIRDYYFKDPGKVNQAGSNTPMSVTPDQALSIVANLPDVQQYIQTAKTKGEEAHIDFDPDHPILQDGNGQPFYPVRVYESSSKTRGDTTFNWYGVYLKDGKVIALPL